MKNNESNEVTVTVEEALEIIAEHGGYGSVRVYAVYGDQSEYAGQIKGIKSKYHLENPQEYSRIYASSNNGMIPVRKA